MMQENIPIRSVQHWMYCPHRWGLIEIDCAWAENCFVTKANILHERVHESNRYHSREKISYTAVKVYNDLPPYGIYGVTDCLEKKGDRFSIVEYKPSQPKNALYYEEDLMQVFAQKLCVDHVFRCDSEGYLYYADTRKKVKLPLKENFAEYEQKLTAILADIREHLRTGTIPPIRKGQKCSGCSMKDMCMPGRKKFAGVDRSIKQLLESEL